MLNTPTKAHVESKLASMMPKRKAVERSGTKRPRHEKPEVVAESINPFELRVNKRKHHVLGQRGARGERGMPGVSRAKAIEKVGISQIAFLQ